MADVELSKRERQIMDVIWALGEASATQVVLKLHEAPTRTAVRTFLRILEAKGHLRHRKQGREFVYFPRGKRQAAGQSALKRVLRVFFEGSLEKAVAAHLAEPGAELSAESAQRLAKLIAQARKRGETS